MIFSEPEAYFEIISCCEYSVLQSEDTMVPNIDYSLCQGCGGCSDAFPDFFEFRDDRAWVINAARFRAEEHKGVLKVCPYYAITLV